jgi:multidrug efflux pump subunit AcrB
MTLPTLCIERPVMTTLLTMAIVAAGSVSYFFLPVAALRKSTSDHAVSTTITGRQSLDDGSFDFNAA